LPLWMVGTLFSMPVQNMKTAMAAYSWGRRGQRNAPHEKGWRLATPPSLDSSPR
jgi:hypothetical protein